MQAKLIRAALAGLLAAIPAAGSTMGNSGGGGGTPSMSAPQFDAAEEYRKGVEALKTNEYGRAKRAFARVLNVAPNDANTNFLAGMADAGLNDFKAAARHYERAVRADAKMVVAAQELAVTYVKLGDLTKAQSALARIKALDAACAGSCQDAELIKTAISTVEAALGQPARAQLTTNPPLMFASAGVGDAAYLRAVGLINEHRYQEAIDTLERARASFGAHPDVLTYLGFANRKLHRYDVAETYYRQALAIAPDHKGATEYYAEMMIERGDIAGAKRMLARLDSICTFGCAEADELRRWVEAKGAPAS